jgi:hypothetical protein
MEARWLAVYRAVSADAGELAVLARAAGVGGEVVDEWLPVAPPPPAEPEAEPEPAE